jgi:hypothetical protein
MNRPEPRFFLVRNFTVDSDALCLENYDFYKVPGLKAIIRDAREAHKTGAGGLEFLLERLDTPRAWLIGKGNRWPEMLPPYECGDPMAFREDLVEVIESSGLTGFTFRRIRIKGWPPLRMVLKRRPRYYCLEPKGSLEYYLKVYSKNGEGCRFLAEAKSFSDPILEALRERYGRYDVTMTQVPILDSWNGSDCIRGREYGHGEFYATLEFVELVRRMNWRGFCAYPMDSLGDVYQDLCERDWPPSLWYPKWQPD